MSKTESKPSRGLIVAHSFGGGAGRAAEKLHVALSNLDTNDFLFSALIGQRKSSQGKLWQEGVSEFSLSLPRKMLIEAVTRAVRWLGAPRDSGLVSPAIVSTGLLARINEAKPDVVNLHWLGHNTLSIREIGAIDAPIVWSLHDEWFYSGATHYGEGATPGDELSRVNRSSASLFDLNKMVNRMKQRHWTIPMHLVVPGHWLATKLGKSSLAKNHEIHVIPYPIDLDLFQPADNQSSRKALGLSTSDKVVLFGANNPTTDPRKGWDLLVEALGRLRAEGQRFHLVVFGNPEKSQESKVPFPIRWLGNIGSDQKLADTYRLADLIAIPSRADNLPLTGLEAQACGIPVVAFDTAGMPDVAVHRETGYLAQPFDTVDLAEGMAWILSDNAVRQNLSEASRTRAEKLWRPSTIAGQYLEVYERAIVAHRR